MNALITWRSLLALLPLLALIQAVVHQIPTTRRKLSKEASRDHLQRARETIAKMLPSFALRDLGSEHMKHPKALKRGHNIRKSWTETVDLNDSSDCSYSTLVGNISVGTPPQNLLVDFDLFYSSDLLVVDSNATLYWSGQPDSENSYNSRYETAFGAIGSSQATVSFGVLDTSAAYVSNAYDTTSAGVVGLANFNSSLGNTTKNLVSQLADELDQPIITIAPSNTPNVTNHLTLGGLDTVHCQSNYAFSNALSKGIYSLNATSAVAINSSGSVVQNATGTVSLYAAVWMPGLLVSSKIHELLVEGTNAKWNNSFWEYVVDCDTNATLVLSVGENQVVITPFDYISSHGDHCVLDVDELWSLYYSDYDSDENDDNSELIYVGQQFLENHCLAYNVATDEVGIASSKVEPPVVNPTEQPENITDTPPLNSTSPSNSTSSSSSQANGTSSGNPTNQTSTVSPPVNSTGPSNSSSPVNVTNPSTNSSGATTSTPPVNSTSSSNSTDANPSNATGPSDSTNPPESTAPTQPPSGSINQSNPTVGSTTTKSSTTVESETEESTTIMLEE
ncbi:eukaryotic aspartyl protease domain-containing protein [Ditylenchus destructor]|uniref:Eukaryotic aspartyl protease domain-containing protein n=1 Tax=Ditylenchus destructor TaxID=166010 RepID=A0AAD4R6M6_9BILA|nr:eukaryotic aspartyl protease domain-containing protein [Ditylenchus destructor]